MSRYQKFLVLSFLIVWGLAAYHPNFPHDWLLENYLVFFFVPIIILLGRYFKLSNVSYTLITLFLCLHVVGSHYTYEKVPFGYFLQSVMNSDRNMYDRLVHFSFGFLLAYPVRELFMRVAKTKGFWSYYFPIDLVAAGSAIYEIIEWLAAANVDPVAGIAFLGSQGDIWDAQKDMLAATVGAIIAMIIIATINAYLDKNFWKELVSSFKINKSDEPLGEVKLQKLILKKNKKR